MAGSASLHGRDCHEKISFVSNSRPVFGAGAEHAGACG